MPQYAPLIKVSNCQKLGANVVLHGKDFAEAKAHAREIGAEKGLAYIDGYDDPAIIAGQGTIGIEIVDQVEDLDAVIRSEEHTSELQSHSDLVCRLLLEK